MGKSLQTRLFSYLLPLALIAMAISAASSVMNVYTERKQVVSSVLDQYTRERGMREEIRFTHLETAHKASAIQYAEYLENLTEQEIDEALERFFTKADDGTLRSRDELFDGTYFEGIGPVHGVASVVSARGEMTFERKRNLVAGLLTVMKVSAGVVDMMESLWYLDEFSDLVIFAPDRPDKLMYYRRTSGPEMDKTAQDFYVLGTQDANPDGRTKCTPLAEIAYVREGDVLTTGCQTPLRMNGAQSGIIGTTLPLAVVFESALNDLPMKDADLYFITNTGSLIAHRDLLGDRFAHQSDVDKLNLKLNPYEFADILQRSGTEEGVVAPEFGAGRDNIEAVYHLKTPDWYLVISYPKDQLLSNAIGAVLPNFISDLLLVFICVGLLVAAVRRFGILPLKLLAQRFSSSDVREKMTLQSTKKLASIMQNEDELGELARTLDSYRRETELNMSRLENEVDERTKELKQAFEAKSKFLATMSHELRTPLNGIVGISGVLLETELSEEQKEMVNLVLESAQILNRELSNVLDVSKNEAGKLELSEDVFVFESAIRSVAGLHAISAANKDIDFRVSIDEACQKTYFGDVLRLQQIVGNLVSNAIKFTQQGHIYLHVSIVEQGETSDSILIRVEDTGCGIAADVIDQVFEPFSQADQKIYSRFGGTGLGLSICRSLTELMGGNISVESEPDKGSVFTVELPLKRDTTRQTEETATPTIVSQEPARYLPAERLRVLVAEDHATNRRVIELILQSLNVDITCVENGKEALDMFRSEVFDLGIVDMQMPVMDGPRAVTAMRQIEEETGRKRLPVIMLSANAMETHIRHALDSGADMHLAKPITPDELIRNIQLVLSQPDGAENRKAS